MSVVKTKPFVINYRKPRVLIGCELVDLNGNIFKSSKEMLEAQQHCNVQINHIVYCPSCGAGNRDAVWGFPRNQDVQRRHKGQCPNCGERLMLEYVNDVGYNTTVVTKKGKKQIEVARTTAKNPGTFASQLKWWPVSDGKLVFETSWDLYFNRTMYGKYWTEHDVIRYRIIFNLDTGMCYSMRGVDRKGNPSKHSIQDHRLQNRTMARLEIVPCAMQEDLVRIALETMKEHKGVQYDVTDLSDRKDATTTKSYAIGDKCIGRDTINLINYFSDMKQSDLSDMLSLDIHRGFCDRSTKKYFKNLISLSKDKEVEWLPQYMQKRSIRSRLNKRVLVFYLYKWLHACGVKDVNVMNRIVDTYINERGNKSAYRDNVNGRPSLSNIINGYCLGTEDSKRDIKFMKWVLKGRDANSVYHFITGMFVAHPYLFTDSARMYQLLLEMNEQPYCHTGNIKEIHDELVAIYNKCKNKNLVIEYTEDEQKLEMDLNGFAFRLAKDTDTLYDIGKAMSICVGSYGRSAAAKHCTILTVSKDDKYVACIELRPRQKELVMQQLKGRFNHTVTEIEPVTEWVAATGINAQCYDYNNAVQHKTNGFDNQERDYHVENPRLYDGNGPFFDDGELLF